MLDEREENGEDTLECPICFIPITYGSGIETVKSDIMAVSNEVVQYL